MQRAAISQRQQAQHKSPWQQCSDTRLAQVLACKHPERSRASDNCCCASSLTLRHTTPHPQIADFDPLQVRHTIVYDDSDTEILRLWDPNQQVGRAHRVFLCSCACVCMGRAAYRQTAKPAASRQVGGTSQLLDCSCTRGVLQKAASTRSDAGAHNRMCTLFNNPCRCAL